jgi:hypothetical protein
MNLRPFELPSHIVSWHLTHLFNPIRRDIRQLPGMAPRNAWETRGLNWTVHGKSANEERHRVLQDSEGEMICLWKSWLWIQMCIDNLTCVWVLPCDRIKVDAPPWTLEHFILMWNKAPWRSTFEFVRSIVVTTKIGRPLDIAMLSMQDPLRHQQFHRWGMNQRICETNGYQCVEMASSRDSHKSVDGHGPELQMLIGEWKWMVRQNDAEIMIHLWKSKSAQKQSKVSIIGNATFWRAEPIENLIIETHQQPQIATDEVKRPGEFGFVKRPC